MNTVREAGSRQEWEAVIAGFAEQPLYLSGSWAEYKRRQGWTPRTLTVPGAAALAQTRRMTRLGPTLTLVQGGPVLAPGTDAAAAVQALFAAANPAPLDIDLLYPAQALTPGLEAALAGCGFREVAMPGTGTVLLDLGRDEPALRAALSKNWRHNLARAEKRGLEVRWVPRDLAARRQAAERMAGLYRALTERKGFAGALDAEALAAAAGETASLEVLEVWHGDVLHASRMAWIGGETALDLLAASSDAARTSYANYLALWALIGRSRERGCRRFDCGGIDPDGNQGVYNFKKGLSGTEIALGRLWLRTRPRLLWPLAARRLGGRLGAA